MLARTGRGNSPASLLGHIFEVRHFGYHTMLEPSCTTSHKSIHPDIMMFTDHFASVLSNFHKMIGTADLEKKRIFEPKNDPGRG